MTDIVGIDNGGARACIVHQGRLVLVGSAAVPDLVLASRVSDVEPSALESPPVDFRLTTTVRGEEVATPADGFWFEQVSARGNAFHAVIQQEGLFILGNAGESNVPAGPFTAAQVEIRENSWYGSERGLTPLIVGGLVMFVQAGGRDMRGIRWDEIQRNYVASSMLTRAGQVFAKAVDVAYSISSGRRPDSAYVVGEDGTVAVLVLPNGAWSTWETREPDPVPEDLERTKLSKFTGIAVPGGHHVFLVERNGTTGVEYFADEEPDHRTWRDPGPTPDGMPITARFEGVPFVAPSRTGTKRSVTKCRMLDVVLEFVDPLVPGRNDDMPDRLRDVEGNQVWMGLRRRGGVDVRDTKRWPRRLRDKETEEITPVRFGGLAGWRTRASVAMEVVEPAELAGFSYKAMG